MRTAAILNPDSVPLRLRRAATASAAGSLVHRWLVTCIAKLIAARRARQSAAIDRAFRSGIAAID